MTKKASFSLSREQRRWLGRAEADVSESGWLEKDSRHHQLLKTYLEHLVGALSKRPTRGRGEWRNPKREDCEVAARIVVREIVWFVDRNPKGVASAKTVHDELARLESLLEETLETLSNFRKRTRNWARAYLASANERWQHERGRESISLPTGLFSAWVSGLELMRDDARDMRAAFLVAREKHIITSSMRLFKRLAIVWYYQTGCWPVISKNAAWPELVGGAAYRNSSSDARSPS